MTTLTTRGLTVHHGGVHANDDVDLQVDAGMLTGLIGPNGAGKTTCIDAVTGFVAPVSGRVELGGRDVTLMPPDARARLGLVRTFQSLELFEDLDVRDNLRVAAERARLRDLVLDVVRPRRASSIEHAVDEALALLGLDTLAGARPTDLSHGQRTLVGVARALAMRPSVLLLDEPAAGLDTHESVALGTHLRDLVDHGLTVLLVDHDMGLVFRVCDHLHVLDFGRVIARGTPEEVRRDPAVVSAYLGGAATATRALPAPPEPGDDDG